MRRCPPARRAFVDEAMAMQHATQHNTLPHNLPVNIKHLALEAVAQHKKNILLSRLTCHTQCCAPLSREFLVILLHGKSPRQFTAVFQQGPPLWCQDPRRRLRAGLGPSGCTPSSLQIRHRCCARATRRMLAKSHFLQPARVLVIDLSGDWDKPMSKSVSRSLTRVQQDSHRDIPAAHGLVNSPLYWAQLRP